MKRLTFVSRERRPLARVAWSTALRLGLDVQPGDLVELNDGRWAIWNDALTGERGS